MPSPWCAARFTLRPRIDPLSILGCISGSFSRPSRLVDHFKDDHADLDGKLIQLPSNFLSPLCRPFFPSPIPTPPPLPQSAYLVPVKLLPVKSPAFALSIPSTPISPPQSLRKPKMLQRDDSPEHLQVVYEFAPLPRYPDPRTPYACQDLVVWRRPNELDMDVSRPQSMRDSQSVRDAPISILYEVFARRIDQLEKDKAIGM